MVGDYPIIWNVFDRGISERANNGYPPVSRRRKWARLEASINRKNLDYSTVSIKTSSSTGLLSAVTLFITTTRFPRWELAAQRSALEVAVNSFGEKIISEISNFDLDTIDEIKFSLNRFDHLLDESYAFPDFDSKFKFSSNKNTENEENNNIIEVTNDNSSTSNQSTIAKKPTTTKPSTNSRRTISHPFCEG